MEVLNDIEDTLDILRPWIMGEAVPGEDPPPLTKDLWRDWWKALKAKRQFLGLDAPKRTHVMTQEAREEPFNQHAAERLARLAAWARETNAINVDGYSPALPPGMTERPTAVESNGHWTVHGSSMWSLAIEFPSED